MLALYLFSLIVGGGFLLLSVLGGGGEGDLDLDGGLDLDGDALDGAMEVDGGDAHDAASRVFSIRTVVYALFGFGATGTLLTQLGGGLLTTLAFSVVGGIAAGLVVGLVFHFLTKTDSGDHLEESTLVGLDGWVSLPIDDIRPGTVMVERGGRRFSLRALPHATTEGDPAEWSRVVVVEMESGVARVAPLDVDDLDALGAGDP